jgi:hypothetical protein
MPCSAVCASTVTVPDDGQIFSPSRQVRVMWRSPGDEKYFDQPARRLTKLCRLLSADGSSTFIHYWHAVVNLKCMLSNKARLVATLGYTKDVVPSGQQSPANASSSSFPPANVLCFPSILQQILCFPSPRQLVVSFTLRLPPLVQPLPSRPTFHQAQEILDHSSQATVRRQFFDSRHTNINCIYRNNVLLKAAKVSDQRTHKSGDTDDAGCRPPVLMGHIFAPFPFSACHDIFRPQDKSSDLSQRRTLLDLVTQARDDLLPAATAVSLCCKLNTGADNDDLAPISTPTPSNKVHCEDTCRQHIRQHGDDIFDFDSSRVTSSEPKHGADTTSIHDDPKPRAFKRSTSR